MLRYRTFEAGIYGQWDARSMKLLRTCTPHEHVNIFEAEEVVVELLQLLRVDWKMFPSTVYRRVVL